MPPLGSPAVKIVVSGNLFTAQPFSWGVWEKCTDVPTQAGLDAVTQAGGADHNAVTTLLETLDLTLSTGCSYSDLTEYGYDAAGNLVAQSTAATPQAGSGTAILPPQSALVVTTLTARFGRSYHGRIYLPFTGTSPGSNGQLGLSFAQTIATAFGTFLSVISEADAAVAAVASFSKHSMEPITSVRVDTVFDTQRRRRDKLVGLQAHATVTPAG